MCVSSKVGLLVSSGHMVDSLVVYPSETMEVVLVRMIVLVVCPTNKIEVILVSISVKGSFCNGVPCQDGVVNTVCLWPMFHAEYVVTGEMM